MRNRHHIIPVSRRGKDSKDNISVIASKPHEKYHALFSNRTPTEILDYLINYFWNGNKEYLHQYLERR